jgi:hypothetical protein
MSAAKAQPIRTPAAAASGSLSAAVRKRIEEARNLIFEAHSIAAVLAAAAVSQMPANEECTETTLRLVSTMLDEVAAMIDPTALAQIATKSEVSNGQA